MASRIPGIAAPGQQVGSVKTGFTAQPFQNLRAPREAFGGGMADALADGGKGLLDAASDFTAIVAQQRKDEEDIRLLERQGETATMERDLLTNPETGYLAKKEKDAMGGYDALKDALKKRRDAIDLDSMTPRERAATERHLLESEASILGRAAAHQRTQTTEYKKRLHTTTIGDAQQAIANGGWRSDTEMQRQLNRVATNARAYGEEQGIRNEKANKALDQYVQEETSAVYETAITAAVNAKNTERAKALLEAAGENLTGDKRVELEKLITTGNLLKTAQDTADKAVAKGDRGQALDWVRAQGLSPEEEKAAVDETNARFAERERIRSERLRQKKEEAVSLAREGKFDQIPPDVLNELGGTMANTLQNISDAKRSGFARRSDPATINELNRMTPEQLEGVELTDEKYLGKLDENDWQKFSDLQGRLIRTKDPATKTAMRTRTQQVAGIKKDMNLSDAQEEALNRRLDEQIEVWEAQNNKKADPTVIRDILDDLLVRGEVKGEGVFDPPDVYRFERPGSAEFYIEDVNQIPERDLAELRAAYKRFNNGAEPSDAELLNSYNQHLASQRTGQ